MGCHLITETMAHRHQLSMESYDRLFPNQDTMPRGGFGNLIALPIQYEPRKQGNTVFLDEKFEPYPDQWAYIASIIRMEPATVEAIAREATRRGQVVGVRLAEPGVNEDAAPWTRLPSQRCHLPAELASGADEAAFPSSDQVGWRWSRLACAELCEAGRFSPL